LKIKLSFLLLLFFTFSAAEKTTFENINIYSEQPEFAEDLAKNLSQDIFDFQKKIGKYPEFPINIYIAADKKQFQKWVGENSGIIEHSQAFYNSKSKAIFARNLSEIRSVSRMRKLLLHEYIHAFVRQYWQKGPLWFNEGLAVYFAGELDINREINFVKEYIMGKSVPLWQMKYNYPKQRINVESFYAKSGLAMKYLFNNKRSEFYHLWDRAEEGKSFESAFLLSFRYTTRDFSAFFEEYSKTHFRAEMLLASTSIIWGFFPIIFLLVIVIRKIRNRRILIKWEAEEKKTTEISHEAQE
jgi:hypothetical protein